MKIYFNARFLTQKQTGVQRFALSCAKNLRALLKDRIIFLAPKDKILVNTKGLGKIKQIGKFNGHLWEQIELPMYLNAKQDELLICCCGFPPIMYKNTMYCIHDLSVYRFPEFFSFIYRQLTKLIYMIALPRIKKIITVSKFSKKEIISFFKVKNISVVNNTVPHFLFDESEISERIEAISNEKFILTVSSMDPRKNLKNLIEAFENMSYENLKLVVVGGQNKIFKFKEAKTNNKDIIFTNYINDSELSLLFKKSKCFVYPSFYEGFGIPPLEAMSNGCPVAASNTSSIPEVCGSAAKFFNPSSSSDIGKTITQLINMSNEEKNKIYQLGYNRVSTYSNDRQRAQLKSVLDELNIRL